MNRQCRRGGKLIWRRDFPVEMKHTIIYTADLHGNEGQYRKLVSRAIEISADSIIIGGDIAPKDFPFESFIEGQRLFLEQRLPELLSQLRDSLPDCRVFLMLGNDDCASNLDVLRQGEPELYTLIHGKRVALTEDFDLVGYAYVPITPFGIKDWEKYDFSRVPSGMEGPYRERKLSNYRLEGFKSAQHGWKRFLFTPEIERKDSIQNDLEQELYRADAEKTVYVVHTPPSGTSLDQVMAGKHVGSMALRAFIEAEQPYLTLHGHIHETVDVSGEYTELVGKTLCAAPGNYNTGEKLAVLEFDLYGPSEMRRILL